MFFGSLLGFALFAFAGAGMRWLTLVYFQGPWTLLLVNALGSFFSGVLLALPLSLFWRTLCVSAFLGSLTSFSAWSEQTLRLIQEGRLGALFLNIGLMVGINILFCFFGHKLSTLLFE